jgi:hypothetical protein
MRTIILTHRLAAARLQARSNFPGAQWLPGDECPIGLRVLRRDGATATVLGEVQYPEGDTNEWWWWLQDDRYPEHMVLDWPPTLRPRSEGEHPDERTDR